MEKIVEEIYGNVATVFHRTHTKNLIDSVKADGYQPGSGSLYGRGFYATYTLDAQCRTSMISSYGEYIFKFAANTTDYFYFDYDQFEKTAFFREWNKLHPQHAIDKSNFIHFQVYRFQLGQYPKESNELYQVTAIGSDLISCTIQPLNNKKIKNTGFANSYDLNWINLFDIAQDYMIVNSDGSRSYISSTKTIEVGTILTPRKNFSPYTRQHYVNEINQCLRDNEYSSVAAKYAADNITELRKKVKGIVYTGANDGTCLVAYDLSTIKPIEQVDTEKLTIYQYMIEEFLSCDDNDDNSANLLFNCDLMEVSNSGDYDIYESGGAKESSSVYLAVVGKDYDTADGAEELLYIDGFSIENGNGLYIKYNEDRITPELARENANSRWTQAEEVDSNLDTYDIEKFLKEHLDGQDIDFIILLNSPDSKVDDVLYDIINNFTPTYKFHTDMESADFSDSKGNLFTVYYVEGYQYQTSTSNDWVSTRAQRKRDRQLNLPI